MQPGAVGTYCDQAKHCAVGVTGCADLQFGVVIRFQDADNYLMAFYSPVQGTLGWHERRNGEFGPWVASRAVPLLKSKQVRLTALAEGDRIRSLLTDDEGNAYVCAGKVDRLKQAGRVGVTHITELLRNGASIAQARELARHSDVKMTMRYTHIGIRDQAQALAALPNPSQRIVSISGDFGCLPGSPSVAARHEDAAGSRNGSPCVTSPF